MDDLEFLEEALPGDAKVTIRTPAGTKETITNVNIEIIAQACPLLAAAFEVRETGHSFVFDDVPTRPAIALLRHAYIGNYTYCPSMLDEPGSLLLHLQMIQLADKWNIPDLRDLAQVYVTRETEYACSITRPVVDLFEGIRFLYLELSHYTNLREIMAHYCLSCFSYHRLGEDETFRQTVYEAPLFHQDLLLANVKSDFAGDGALTIMNLPHCNHELHRNVVPEKAKAANFMCQYHTKEFADTTERHGNPVSSSFRPEPAAPPYSPYRTTLPQTLPIRTGPLSKPLSSTEDQSGDSSGQDSMITLPTHFRSISQQQQSPCETKAQPENWPIFFDFRPKASPSRTPATHDLRFDFGFNHKQPNNNLLSDENINTKREKDTDTHTGQAYYLPATRYSVIGTNQAQKRPCSATNLGGSSQAKVSTFQNTQIPSYSGYTQEKGVNMTSSTATILPKKTSPQYTSPSADNNKSSNKLVNTPPSTHLEREYDFIDLSSESEWSEIDHMNLTPLSPSEKSFSLINDMDGHSDHDQEFGYNSSSSEDDSEFEMLESII